MKPKHKLILLLITACSAIALATVCQGANLTGTVQDAFGISASTRIRLTPRSPYVSTSTWVSNIPVSITPNTNGSFSATNLFGGYYDSDPGNGGQVVRILLPFNDTNTYTFFQAAQLAINAQMYGPSQVVLTNSGGPLAYTNLLKQTWYGFQSYPVFAGSDYFATNDDFPGQATKASVYFHQVRTNDYAFLAWTNHWDPTPGHLYGFCTDVTLHQWLAMYDTTFGDIQMWGTEAPVLGLTAIGGGLHVGYQLTLDSFFTGSANLGLFQAVKDGVQFGSYTPYSDGIIMGRNAGFGGEWIKFWGVPNGLTSNPDATSWRVGNLLSGDPLLINDLAVYAATNAQPTSSTNPGALFMQFHASQTNGDIPFISTLVPLSVGLSGSAKTNVPLTVDSRFSGYGQSTVAAYFAALQDGLQLGSWTPYSDGIILGRNLGFGGEWINFKGVPDGISSPESLSWRLGNTTNSDPTKINDLALYYGAGSASSSSTNPGVQFFNFHWGTNITSSDMEVDVPIIASQGITGTPTNTAAQSGVVTPPSGPNLVWKSDGSSIPGWRVDSTGGTPSFDTIASGNNTTAAMTVGTGATLSPAGSGTITANALSATTPQLVGATNTATLGSQGLSLKTELVAGTNTTTLHNQGLALDTELVAATNTTTLHNQGLALDTELVAATNSSTLGTQLKSMTNTAILGSQGLTLKTELVAATNTATLNAQGLALETELVAATNSATLGTQLKSMTNTATLGSQGLTLKTELVAATNTATLGSQGLTLKTELVAATNTATLGSQGLTLKTELVAATNTTTLLAQMAGQSPSVSGINFSNVNYTMPTNNGNGLALVAGSPGTTSTFYITNITVDTTLAAMTFDAARNSGINLYVSCSGGTDRKLIFPANFVGSGALLGVNLQSAGITITNGRSARIQIDAVPGLFTNVFWSPN